MINNNCYPCNNYPGLIPSTDCQKPKKNLAPIFTQSVYNEYIMDDLFTKQDNIAISNQISINSIQNNANLANKVLTDFNKKYPNLESYTMENAILINMKKGNPNDPRIPEMEAKTDKLFNKMISIYESHKENMEDMSFQDYLKNVKSDFETHKFGNCGERAYVIYDELNKRGCKNHKIIEIEGKENDNSHVFNVIGLAPNADITKPETWGKNAVVVDAWSNKVLSAEKALEYYHDFLGYSEDNPMRFKEDDPAKIFKSV